MLTVMPIVVVPCLVGGYWLPKLSLYLFARCCVREEVLIEWDNDVPAWSVLLAEARAADAILGRMTGSELKRAV